MSRRRQIPALANFDKNDLPKELLDGVNLAEAASEDVVHGVIQKWMNMRTPTVLGKERCTDVITGTDNARTRYEIERGALLAMCGYAMPYYMPEIAQNFGKTNAMFSQIMTNVIAESTKYAYDHYDKLLTGKVDSQIMPDKCSFNGFYIHTPVQIWNKKGSPVRKIPPWHERVHLLQKLVIGNVNCYVTRTNITENQYECNVLFRGTSNEFNGLHQYGEKLGNSPVFNMPKYDPIRNKYYKNGSADVPLFYEWYCTMLDQIKPHIYWCLTQLGAFHTECSRVTFTGHSMGGALVHTFCYLLKHDQPALWEKSYFRAYATPLCSNDAAVLQVEKWVVESQRTNKYLEVVNTDDFVNLQYLAGGKEGVEASVKAGTHELIAVLLSYRNELPVEDQEDDTVFKRMVRIAQTYPEVAMAAFLRGAIREQPEHISEDRLVGQRMGQRYAESKLWGTRELAGAYNQTLRLCHCTRDVDFSTEYFGKSHSGYVGVDTNTFWASLRSYEDDLYRRYAKEGLKPANNRLVIMPMFNKDDIEYILPTTKKYVKSCKTYKPEFLKIFRKL